MTSGTFDFLKAKIAKYSKEKIILMENNEEALLLHESSGGTLFQTARKYELIDSYGELSNDGFVAMNFFPVTVEGKPLFEYQAKKLISSIKELDGLKCVRLLKKLDSETYNILTIWVNEKAYQNWKNSESYSAFQQNKKGNGINNTNSIFAMPPYQSNYYIVKN